ncbi:MAG: FMN-binding protein [Phycisphaerales bacterium]|nr:MAG: FMN-binding protein [Phycisphaerales bacterium]
MKGSAYTLIYAAALGTVCATVLTFADSFTEERRVANQQAEEALNILLALKVPLPEKVSSKQIVEARKQNIEERMRGDLTTYVYYPPDATDEVLATAVRFSGPGLWGPIKGFLALEPDMKTIRGMTFYEQEETPGLGGEIATEGFRKRFVGKTIHDKDGNVGIVICKPGSAKEQNEVDGITGATMTCDKVQAMLNEAIKRIVEEK